MVSGATGTGQVADVKCYHCGHISGQIVSQRGEQLRVSNFMPRPGYSGELPKPGSRLRCERCKGPVFLEDAGTPPGRLDARTGTRTRRARSAAL